MKSTPPFFSVIIPTKNRSQVVGNAVQSVLDQSFADWEIVLVDNDDTQATGVRVREFRDKRIRIIRTGGLTMPDNWERGFTEARGLYQLILEDKSVLKPRALAVIRAAIAKHPSCEVVSWPQDLFNDSVEPPVVLTGVRSEHVKKIDCDEVLRMLFTLPRGHVETVLPRGLNSCLHQFLAERIRRGPFGRVCPPVSPDYTLACLQLAYADSVLNIEDCLTVYGSCVLSHGRDFLNTETMRKGLERDFGVQFDDLFSHVPLKGNLVSACLFNDYARIRERIGLRLERFPIDLKHFFLECRRDLDFAAAMGVDKTLEKELWQRTLDAQEETVRNGVLERLAPPKKDSVLKRMGRGLGLHRLRRAIGGEPDATASAVLPTFDSPLSYVKFEATTA